MVRTRESILSKFGFNISQDSQQVNVAKALAEFAEWEGGTFSSDDCSAHFVGDDWKLHVYGSLDAKNNMKFQAMWETFTPRRFLTSKMSSTIAEALGSLQARMEKLGKSAE